MYTPFYQLFFRCDGSLLAAIKAGHWILLDELKLAGQSVLDGPNAILTPATDISSYLQHTSISLSVVLQV